jgi:prepilin-type N-terminal cleavage/methylation domain-containing protein
MSIFRKSSVYQIKKGFTLIELMVVISIIVIFIAIILAAISTARENTREKRRIADLAQIEFALTLYKEKNREYPPGSFEIGHGGFDEEIRKYIGHIPTDPNSDGVANGAYGYWYDSNFSCDGKSGKVLYAKKMEQAKNANREELCGSGGNPMYIVVLKE